MPVMRIGSIDPAVEVDNKASQPSLMSRGCRAASLHTGGHAYGSGAGLLLIATKGGNLLPKLLRPLLIATGQGHSQGEFELFQLMLTIGLAGERIRSGLTPSLWCNA